MCKHRYKDYESLPKEKQYCFFNELIDLPLDKDGMCIFHSTNIKWKREQDFVKCLEKLKETLIEKQQDLNFSEFHFVAGKGKTEINYFHLFTDSDLQYSTFHQMLHGEDLNIQGSLNFSHCTLYPIIRFVDCNFEGTIKFTEIDVTDHSLEPMMIFHECMLSDTFYYVENKKVNMSFSFRGCEFDSIQMEDFRNEEYIGEFECMDCDIKVFDLRNCMIYNPDFTGTTFYTADIYNVSFREETVFENITIESNLKFVGGDDYAIFEGTTRFMVDYDNLQGQIYFENANLSTFLKKDKEKLLEFEKKENGKVQIGSGCIKYRILSPDMTYKIKDFHQHLITEIGHSFATFFTQYNGFNLGIEVRNKTKNNITLFYFTDDDVDKEEFIQMLGMVSERIFGVVPENMVETPHRQDAVVDFQIDFIRSLTKIAHRIHNKNWGIKDSKIFFDALNFSPNIYLDEKSAHAFLEKIDVNDFLQKVKGLSVNVNQKGDKNTFIGVVSAEKSYKS